MYTRNRDEQIGLEGVEQARACKTLGGYLRRVVKADTVVPVEWMTADEAALVAEIQAPLIAAERERRVREYRDVHHKKKRPGLMKLLALATQDQDNALTEAVTILLADVAKQEANAEEARQQKAALEELRQTYQAKTLDELIQIAEPSDELRAAMMAKCVRVDSLAAQLSVSSATVRKWLDELRIRPLVTDSYTTGSYSYRRDVTAHYYHPDVIHQLATKPTAMKRLAAKQEAADNEEFWRRYELETGFLKR